MSAYFLFIFRKFTFSAAVNVEPMINLSELMHDCAHWYCLQTQTYWQATLPSFLCWDDIRRIELTRPLPISVSHSFLRWSYESDGYRHLRASVKDASSFPLGLISWIKKRWWSHCIEFPSVICHCPLDRKKNVQPVKNPLRLSRNVLFWETLPILM